MLKRRQRPQKPINPEQTRTVELNDTTLTFELNADTATVNIGSSEGWWIEEITTEEDTLKPTAEEKQLMAGGGAYEARCQWVSMKRNGSSIEVAVDDNVYKERTFKIVLATADSTATITGVQEEMITGWWDDIIGLSTKTVTLNGAGDPATVTTEGKHWWITSIEVDGETLYSSYYDNTENRNMYQTGKFNKKCDWLNVSVDDWTLNISADMNYGEERTFRINVEAGDYFDYINGTQEELMTGGGTPINLKPKQVTIPAEGGTQTCTTDKDIAWIIHCTYINDNIYYATLDEKKTAQTRANLKNLRMADREARRRKSVCNGTTKQYRKGKNLQSGDYGRQRRRHSIRHAAGTMTPQATRTTQTLQDATAAEHTSSVPYIPLREGYGADDVQFAT